VVAVQSEEKDVCAAYQALEQQLFSQHELLPPKTFALL
jgi:hypothetical protein